jgi:5-hydroxyisourate hydrolase-like protein (transthyretin family)
VITNPDIRSDQTSKNNVVFNTESNFRIVPEKPNVGSTIRIIGDKFTASQELDFYINSKKLGSFTTDENGYFITTMKIPKEEKVDRVDFKVKAQNGEEKKISIRLGENKSRIPELHNIKLAIQGLPNIVHKGDFLEINGTGTPNSAITVTITTEKGEIINSRIAEVNSKGNWKLSEPIIISLDAQLGKYNIIITDGRQNMLKQWIVESNKIIAIIPDKIKFDRGETMGFSGTALPNQLIKIILKDPLGKEIFTDTFQVNESGQVKFEHKTELTSIKGTYTVIATQGENKELIFTGLGEFPIIPVVLEFDQLNYKAGDTAIISIIGKASEIVNLLIIDPSNKPKEDPISITLQPNGTGIYHLKLSDYASGVYTSVVSKGSTQSTQIFTVGLQTGSGNIEITTTKTNYLIGDTILILGSTSPNIIFNMSLKDPDGNSVSVKESFSDKNGKISEILRIPSDGKTGTWLINAKSGSNFDTIEIKVLATINEGMMMSITDGVEIPGLGKTIQIKIIGAAQTVKIEIITEDGKILETLSVTASDQGEVDQPWIVPKNTTPGTYTVKAQDAFNVIEGTFNVSV